jgi:hypothetical protein
MKIEIESSEVREARGENSRGRWSIREQKAFADLGKRYPAEIRLRLPKDQQAYAPGTYELDVEKSCFVDGYGNLKLGAIALRPVVAPARKVG